MDLEMYRKRERKPLPTTYRMRRSSGHGSQSRLGAGTRTAFQPGLAHAGTVSRGLQRRQQGLTFEIDASGTGEDQNTPLLPKGPGAGGNSSSATEDDTSKGQSKGFQWKGVGWKELLCQLWGMLQCLWAWCKEWLWGMLQSLWAWSKKWENWIGVVLGFAATLLSFLSFFFPTAWGLVSATRIIGMVAAVAHFIGPETLRKWLEALFSKWFWAKLCSLDFWKRVYARVTSWGWWCRMLRRFWESFVCTWWFWKRLLIFLASIGALVCLIVSISIACPPLLVAAGICYVLASLLEVLPDDFKSLRKGKIGSAWNFFINLFGGCFAFMKA